MRMSIKNQRVMRRDTKLLALLNRAVTETVMQQSGTIRLKSNEISWTSNKKYNDIVRPVAC